MTQLTEDRKFPSPIYSQSIRCHLHHKGQMQWISNILYLLFWLYALTHYGSSISWCCLRTCIVYLFLTLLCFFLSSMVYIRVLCLLMCWNISHETWPVLLCIHISKSSFLFSTVCCPAFCIIQQRWIYIFFTHLPNVFSAFFYRAISYIATFSQLPSNFWLICW